MPRRTRYHLLLPLLVALAPTTHAGELLEAAREGNAPRAISLLEAGASPSETGRQGDTALHWAAFNDQLGFARVLVARGAPVNARVNNGNTPLHQAAYAGHLEMVALLMEAGADPMRRNEEGLTAVEWANQRQHAMIVIYMVERGAAPPRPRRPGAPAPTVQPESRSAPLDMARLRGMSRNLGELPSVVMRVPDSRPPDALQLTPQRQLGPPPALRPASAAAPAVPAAPAQKTTWLQLGSFRSNAEARSHWQQLTRSVPELLGGFDPIITTGIVTHRGEYRRLRIGPLGRAQAKRLCGELRKAKRDCLLVERRKPG